MLSINQMNQTIGLTRSFLCWLGEPTCRDHETGYTLCQMQLPNEGHYGIHAERMPWRISPDFYSRDSSSAIRVLIQIKINSGTLREVLRTCVLNVVSRTVKHMPYKPFKVLEAQCQ